MDCHLASLFELSAELGLSPLLCMHATASVGFGTLRNDYTSEDLDSHFYEQLGHPNKNCSVRLPRQEWRHTQSHLSGFFALLI
jgi:hypothetical protein